MFDLQVLRTIAIISERTNGKKLVLNEVSVNGGKPMWDLGSWMDGQRLGGVLMYDDEMEILRDELSIMRL